MSLAQPPSYQSSHYSASPSPFNPFGPHSILGTESVAESQASDSSLMQADAIHAPQGRIPMTAPTFAPPSLSANAGHIDFIRGFGLDIPLESEEEEEEERRTERSDGDGDAGDVTQDTELYNDGSADVDDGTTTAPQSRLHSRHVSKLSAALSLRSVGGNFQAQFPSAAEEAEQREEEREADERSEEDEKENQPPQNLDADPVEEWTGSEDLYMDTSDDEVSLLLYVIKGV
jgi:ribosomal protein L12E/L44/L45/RPP1/RPP2